MLLLRSCFFYISFLLCKVLLCEGRRRHASRGGANAERHGATDHMELLRRQQARKPAKTPEEREKYVHQYFGSPPPPFNKKGEWEGTVHYDWGWCK